MMERQNPYPSNLTELLAYQNVDLSANVVGEEKFNADSYADGDHYADNDRSSPSIDDGDSSQSAFGVDLTKGTNLSGKSFTIAAILGLTGAEEEMRIQSQRHLQNYLYGGRDVRLSEGFCRAVVPAGLRQDSPRPEIRSAGNQMKTNRNHVLCSSGTGRSKRIRTIFTPEQLERLEAEFERQQYMVGPERLYLAHALQLTEAQVKVWFQNRRIKWRKHHLEVTQQRLAILHRHRPDERDDDI